MRMVLFSVLGRKTRGPHRRLHHRLSSSILLLRCCWLVEHGCCFITTPTPRMSSHSLVANIDNSSSSSSRKKPKRTIRTMVSASAAASLDAHAGTHDTTFGVDPLITMIPQSVCEELLIGPAAATLAATAAATGSATATATVVSAADVIDTMKFAYPYWYDPHPLAKWAAQQIQQDLSVQHVVNDDDAAADNAARKNRPRSGQMYGVLVVSILEDPDQETHQPPPEQEQTPTLKFGYLKAYTGRTNKFKPRTGITRPGRFVPLLYDRYSNSNTSSFCYTTELKKLHDLAQQIERMKNDKAEEDDQKKNNDNKSTTLEDLKQQTDQQLQELKLKHKRQKQIRKDRREGLQQQLVVQQHQQPNPNAEGTAILRNDPQGGTKTTTKAWHKYLLETTQNVQYCALEAELVHASAVDQRELKELKHHIHTLLQPLQQKEHAYHQTVQEFEHRLTRETQQLQRTVYQQYKLWNFQTGTTNNDNNNNINNNIQTITQLFSNHKITPIPLDGCGDCSSIKLFQYAFQQRHTITNRIHPKKQLVVQPHHSGTNTTGSNHVNDKTTTHDADRKRTRETENDYYTRYHYRPIALAEFWWGTSPHASGNHPATSTQAARQHQYYYPICRGLNEPLLSGHVLRHHHEHTPGTPSDTRCAGRPIGIQVEKNPMYTNNNPTTTEDDNTDDSSRSISIPPLDIVYEDEYMLIINKAHNVLSVPGPTIDTSIELQIRDKVRVALPPLPVPSPSLDPQQQKQPTSPAPMHCDDAVDDGRTSNNQNSHRKSNRRKKNNKNQNNTQASATTDRPASSYYKGPYLVHRLDYSTSGLLLAAKDAKTHKNLQAQFMKRTTKKRYEALLVGDPFRILVNDDVVREDATTTNSYSDTTENDNGGNINLPLAGDYINRPMQKVDYSSDGKSAVTKYEVIGVEQHNDDDDDDDGDHQNGDEGCTGTPTTRTRIYLYPVTGRTHQLRVHASHPDGPIKSPIVGDDIYGQRNNSRLCLHAGFLEINHPNTGNRISFTAAVPF